jgi:hypothetical protein
MLKGNKIGTVECSGKRDTNMVFIVEICGDVSILWHYRKPVFKCVHAMTISLTVLVYKYSGNDVMLV